MALFVLLVEDNFDLAASIVKYLELKGVVCDHAASGEAGLNLAKENDYDVILLDIMLPRLSGLDLCETLRNTGQDTPVLMLTARDTLDDKQAGFASGTDDYLVKPFDMPELMMRINALARRRSGQARVLKALDITMHLDSKEAFRGARRLTLTPTGWNLLEILVRACPAVVSRSKIIQAIWGDDVPETNVLKVQIYKLRHQLNDRYAPPVLYTVSGHGYVLKDGNDGPP
ncbi:MAG: response regulator transcription factor [Desulfobacterales bacterium]|nr:response regulator transcription factor [Desulfobacterales bacterium]